MTVSGYGGAPGKESPFILNVALPGLLKVEAKLRKKGRMVAIEHSDGEAALIVVWRTKLEIRYVIRVLGDAPEEFAEVTTYFSDSTTGMERMTEPETLQVEGQNISVRDAVPEDIEDSFFEHYHPLDIPTTPDLNADDLQEF